MTAAAALGAVVPGAASGRPGEAHAHIDGYPTVSGTAQVGEVLTATTPSYGPPGAEARWYWLRCSGVDADTESVSRECRFIDSANSTSYRATDADVGRYLRALLVVTADRSTAYAYSAAAGPVATRPVSTPTSTPTPTPTPSPTPTPPVSTPVPPPATVTPPPAVVTPPPDTGAVLGQHKRHRRHHRARMMRPRPIVRIRGWLTPTGARVTLLTVRAPRRARVRVRCYGSSCPRRHWAHTTALLHLVPFERRLRAGTRIVIRVTKRGYIGKYTVLRLRRGRRPARLDRCLYPRSSHPRRCPSR